MILAIIAPIDSSKAIGLYNVATGAGLTVEEEVKLIVKVFSPLGKPSKLIYCPEKPGAPNCYIYDISRIKRDMGWTPKYSYEDMLEDYKREIAIKCEKIGE